MHWRIYVMLNTLGNKNKDRKVLSAPVNIYLVSRSPLKVMLAIVHDFYFSLLRSVIIRIGPDM